MNIKKILSLLTVAGILCCLVGCNDNRQETTVENSESSSFSVTESTIETEVQTETEKQTTSESSANTAETETKSTTKVSEETFTTDDSTVTIAGENYQIDAEEIYISIPYSDNINTISLKNIEKLENLKSLKISSGNYGENIETSIKILNIIDYEGLYKLKNLESLELINVIFYKNDVPDDDVLLGLKNLKKLTYSYVDGNMHITPSDTVEELCLCGGDYRFNVSSVIDLTNIEKQRNVKKISIINISEFSVVTGKIQNYEKLLSLSQLEDVSIGCCFFYKGDSIDYDFLTTLTNMKSLSLFEFNLDDWYFMNKLTNLEILDVWGCNIVNISFIDNMPNLQRLSLSMLSLDDYQEACELVKKNENIVDIQWP